ncbi:hypothetical protein LTS12_015021 [Elasticomyces elasticus]|nr:hypothetical protein LTS12_015021 [Elasticomyces elasticus]
MIRLHTRSTARSLFEVMDAVEFVIATGILFSNEDVAKYTSVFKYIITDRRWLTKKMKEGYTFTMMGRSLCAMMDYNVGSDRALRRAQEPLRECLELQGHAHHLIVTNDKHFIPCTKEFMPMHLFLNSVGHEHIEENTITDSAGIVTRCTQTNWNGIKIHIACPIAARSRPTL